MINTIKLEVKKNHLEIRDKQIFKQNTHKNNVSNFEVLVSICANNIENYKPVHDVMRLHALNSILYMAKNSLNSVNQSFQFYQNALSDRSEVLNRIKRLILRVKKNLEVNELAYQISDSAKRLLLYHTTLEDRMIEELVIMKDETIDKSVSQELFNTWLEKLNEFIKLVSSTQEYIVDEDNILNTLLKEFYYVKGKNASSIIYFGQLKNARIARDYVLYNAHTGLVDVADDVIDYIRSRFGELSPQYIEVSTLEFISRK